MVSIVCCALVTLEAGTFVEHVTRIADVRIRPVFAHVDGSKASTAVEHLRRIKQTRCLPSAQVNSLQRRAECKHSQCTSQVLNIPSAQVEAGEFALSSKHLHHVCHLACVEVIETRDVL